MTETMNAPAWASQWTRAALAELPADITTATPPQVDEVIRTVGLDVAHMEVQAGRAVRAVRGAMGQEAEQVRKPRGRGYESQWPNTAAEAIAEARAMDPGTKLAKYGMGPTVGEALAELDAVRAQFREADAIVEPLAAEFARRGGWARYYRVNNSNGHVHTTMACRECYATTQFNWPTMLSGADGDQVVEAAGALTCLTCFPEQRADILAGRPTRFEEFETTEQRAARAEREAEAAARKAAKIANGVTADGSPLTVQEPSWREGYTNTVEIKTERAAQLRYVEFSARATWKYGTQFERDGYAAAARQLAEALAWKRNTSVDKIERTLAKKVAKKIETTYSG